MAGAQGSSGATDVVIVGAARTAVGTYNGALKPMPAHELAATAIRTALARAGVEASAVDEVVLGQVGQVGADAYNARRSAVAAGLGYETTAHNVNRLCGSGLQAIWTGTQQIRLDDARVVVAGGNESMSRQPYLDYAARQGDGRLGHHTAIDGTLSMVTDPFGGYPMGETAERVAERCSVGRADQDAFALESQRRTAAAIEAGRFQDQIAPVTLPDGSTFERDEHPRPGATLEQLGRLRPVFREGGTVTAGNASGVNDGAAAVVLMSGAQALAEGRRVQARVVGGAVTGIEPDMMGLGPVAAMHRLAERTGVPLTDIDVIELNEAFAAQAVAVIRALDLDPDRVNPNGGAIALGHPIGATGAILTVKLLAELERRDLRYGAVTMCIGGGQGIALLFERLA